MVKKKSFTAADLDRIANLAGIKANLPADVLDKLRQQLKQTIQPPHIHHHQQPPIHTWRTSPSQPQPFFSYEQPPPADEEEKFQQAWRNLQMDSNWKKWTTNLSGKQVAKVWLDEGKGVLCARFPYSQPVIDDIRAKIPKGKKSWRDDEKVWEFSVETIKVVIEILGTHFDEVLDLTQSTTPQLSSPTTTDPLLQLLDEEDISKIYRLLAIKYHPDKQGGDSDKMAKINQVFSHRNGKKGDQS